MHVHRPRAAAIVALAAVAVSLGAVVTGQTVPGTFERFWGDKFAPAPTAPEPTVAGASRADLTRAAGDTVDGPSTQLDARGRLKYWNGVAIDTAGLDHSPVASGEIRTFGEQLGPGRSSRAMAIVHIAIFDAVNAIFNEWRSYTGIASAEPGASVDAAIAQAAHDTLVDLYPSHARSLDAKLAADLARQSKAGRDAGRKVGRRAADAILALRRDDGSEKAEPQVGVDFIPSNAPGKWRPDPVSQIPVALGAYWGQVRPFVIPDGAKFRVPPPPPLRSPAYATSFNEVKQLGGDGETTPTERSDEESSVGIYWAYDGTPSLCAPPRLYNQLAMTIADQMGSDFLELTRLLTLVNVAMADAGIAIWESKYYYQLWRPVTGIRESDRGTGPTGRGDGNPATEGDPTFMPMGAPASNLSGPSFTPPFPAYPSGHAGFGGALFEVLRRFYGTDDIAFTFTSDEYNGQTLGQDGVVRPLHPRSFTSLSQAEAENGQSRIYLGIHWSFDKTQGIAQGRKVARFVMRNAFARK